MSAGKESNLYFQDKARRITIILPALPLLLSQAAISITNKNNINNINNEVSYFHKHDNENLYEFLSCEIIGAKDGFEPSSYRDISYTIYHWKYFAQYFIVGMVRYHQFESHAYRRILLSVLLVPQTTLHIGSLCFMANCLLPHLLITGWLLTIYSNAFVWCPS